MDDPLNEFLIKDSTSQGLSSNEETERRDGAGNLLRFKIDKKKRFKLTLEVFRDIFQICLRVPDRKFDPIPSEEDTVSFLRELGHTRIYGVVLPECLTSPEMKESKEYKTYSWPCIPDEEPVTKGKRVKRSVKKSSTKPATGIVIREPLVEAKSKGKEKEKVDVAHGKGIKLLSEVALTEKAQLKEVRKKSLRDFHMTHPSGSGTGAEKPLSVEKITPTVTSEGTGDKPGVPDVTEDDSTESESESWGNDEDDSNNEQEASDEGSGQENESEEQESDSEQDEESDDDNQEEEEVMVFVDVEMNDAQQGNENLKTTQEQVVEDAHVTISTVTKKTEVLVTSSSRSSDLAYKFLNFLDIP
ncbi:hypothetical protein Tco_1446518 [Tanacetum coccineum]